MNKQVHIPRTEDISEALHELKRIMDNIENDTQRSRATELYSLIWDGVEKMGGLS